LSSYSSDCSSRDFEPRSFGTVGGADKYHRDPGGSFLLGLHQLDISLCRSHVSGGQASDPVFGREELLPSRSTSHAHSADSGTDPSKTKTDRNQSVKTGSPLARKLHRSDRQMWLGTGRIIPSRPNIS